MTKTRQMPKSRLGSGISGGNDGIGSGSGVGTGSGVGHGVGGGVGVGGGGGGRSSSDSTCADTVLAVWARANNATPPTTSKGINIYQALTSSVIMPAMVTPPIPTSRRTVPSRFPTRLSMCGQWLSKNRSIRRWKCSSIYVIRSQ